MNIRSVYLNSVLLCATVFSYDAAAKHPDRNVIVVNDEVTTHIVMPENLKLVDISTENIIGNQCTDNMVRIKPAPADSLGRNPYGSNEFLGTITLIGERHIAQYDILYDRWPSKANSIYNVSYDETQRYTNPDVSMPESEMARFAWAIYGTKPKFHNIKTNAYGIKAAIHNIYAIGNYFFIDFSLENKTNVEYDIDEIRVTLTDKKETKATNSQTIQINPVYTLNPVNKFKKNYRQIMVLDKLTYPEEKIINISVSENQISGRTITLSMEYEDVLNADGFDISKINKVREIKYIPVEKEKIVKVKVKDDNKYKAKCSVLESEVSRLNSELDNSNKEIKRLNSVISRTQISLAKMEEAYKGASSTIERILAKDN